MRRLVCLLVAFFALSAPVWGAPAVDHKTFFIDATRSPVCTFERSGLTVYIPFADPHDFHNGLAPRAGVIGYPDFARASSAYRIDPGSGLLTSVATQTPRFEKWDGKIGLLLEPTSTNNAKRSEEFHLWGTFHAGVTADAIQAPNGTVTADQIYEDSDNNQHHCSFGIGKPWPVNSMVCVSVFAKANERNWCRLLVRTYDTQYPAGFYNLATGEIGTNSGASEIGIDPVGNGWYRVWMTFMCGSGAADMNIYMGLASADNIGTYAGDGSSSLYIWGYQAENFGYPTSYIPVSSVTSFRSEEQATPEYTLPNGVFDGDGAQGTAILFWNPLFDYDTIPQDTWTYGIFSVRNGSSSSLIRMHHSSAGNGRIATLDNAASAPYVNADWSRNEWIKIAVKWGYLDSGQSKFNIGYDSGAGVSWGTAQNFTTYNTTGTKMEFATTISIAPFLVRDLMIFDRVLTDGEINQLGWLP